MLKYKKTITVPHLEEELDIISKKIEILNLPKGFFQFIIYTISELFANIKEHARINKMVVVLKINRQKNSIYIADKGIGFKQSYLSKQIYVKDDSSAIEFALSGLSTKSPQGRGFGLYSIRKFVEELNGKMLVESGSVKAVIQKDKINFQYLKRKTKGVSISLMTPIKKINFYRIIR